MKAHLLYVDRDIDLDAAPISNLDDLAADLESDHLLAAMAAGDQFLFDVARCVVFHSLDAPEQILYRQGVLTDCIDHPGAIRELYAITEETLERKKKFWLGAKNQGPGRLLHRSVQILEMLMEQLAELRDFADQHHQQFHSVGLTTLLTTLAAELDDGYLAEVRAHLDQLQFHQGARMTARLGPGNQATDYLLHATPQPTWQDRLRLRLGPRDALTVQIADRDQAGFEALGRIRSRGLEQVAQALDQATNHVIDFFTMLHTEVAFFVGCLNLHDALDARAQPTCLPEPTTGRRATLVTHDLRDPCLALLTTDTVFGNDLDADGKTLIVITGANRGGKTTLLRSIGLAQLMMQCGMFVTAQTYRSELHPGVFTHFKREEDPTLTSGKLDEELRRMSGIVDQIHPNSLLLCNESFASTNEQEGSQIATGIITTMQQAGVKIVYVTHLFELAHGFSERARPDHLFLRAEPASNRAVPFRLVEGAPLPTSHGAEIYERVFGEPPHTRA